MSKYSGVKGMNDLLPPQVDTWQFLERTARETLNNYGYAEIRTPIVEDTELFTRSVGEGTDIVGKEMYCFDDKGGRNIAMRPEGTAPAARAYLEHSLHQKEPVTRWYYLGPMFRYERMKTGRYRQFWQLGVEAYGAGEPAQDVETMELAVHFLERLGLTDVSLQINSLGDETTRPAYVEKVRAHFSAHVEKMSDDAKQTLATNPMRLLDSKEEALRPLISTAPVMLDALDEGSKVHFAEVRRLLELVGIRYEINPRLVRGLDYYTRTAFELVAKSEVLGTASTVGGGGRYDRLIEQLGGPKVPAVGWAMGIDRLCLLLGEKHRAEPPVLFILPLDPPAKDEALKLVTQLRHQGLKVDFDARGGSMKAQFKRAAHVGARWVLVLGERELAERKAKLKHQSDGSEREVALDALAEALRT
jgi:histidyl-tRNA synthetase